MKNSSDFTITEIEKLISISNLMGINIPEDKSASVELYLDAIFTQLKTIPYTPFPVSFHTVDIIPFMQSSGNDIQILLGRKHDSEQFQIIGGFMDPGETNIQAAKRELKEESNMDCIHELDYLGSFFIDDSRFRDSCHKVTTSLFAYYTFSEEIHNIKGMDDIAEVKWFDVDILEFDYKAMMAPLHHPLFETFMDWLRKNAFL